MPWDSVHPFECPTRVFYGRGASHAVGEHCSSWECAHALIVSDPGVAGAGIVDAIVERLRDAGVEASVYAGTQPNPTTTNVAEAAALYREHACDGLVGLGGGSSMDCAKGAGIEVANGGDVARFTGRDNVPNELPRLLCIRRRAAQGRRSPSTR